jgi:cupin-like protein
VPKTVDRREGPISRKLLLDLAVRQQPVIFKELFAGQAVRQIAGIADLPADWANTRVRPREPAERINHPGKSFDETTVLQFLTTRAPPRFVQDTKAVAPSNAFIVLPETLADWGARHTRFDYYMGNAGAFTHLHFDANCRQNLHYQLIGKKRFLLFPEDRSKYLAPQQQSSRIFLERISAVERLHFADYAGGYDCTLEPGDSLYIPPLAWHYVEYEEPSISLSFRFGKSRYNDDLHQAIGGFHATVEFQHIAAGLLDDEAASPVYRKAHHEILAAVGSKYEFPRVQARLEALCRQICPEKIECLYAKWPEQDHGQSGA